VFVGASIGVAKNNHIQVDLLYRYLPKAVARAMATLVDAVRIAFFASMTVFTVQMMQKMGNYQMTIIDLPMNIVYGVVLFGFAAMTLRSVWVAKVHLQRGYSVLERPETTMADR
jgi:TRAP-type C4-dicarboxylate transport system permease small subunit